jgi:hypothetical protein
MRLEPFCKLSMRYVNASWHRPYPSRGENEEALGFGQGDGTVSGETERAAGHRRAILARVELTTEAEPYRWLNTCFLVGKGEIDEERENWWLDTYVCLNEQVHGPHPRSAQNRPSASAKGTCPRDCPWDMSVQPRRQKAFDLPAAAGTLESARDRLSFHDDQRRQRLDPEALQ